MGKSMLARGLVRLEGAEVRTLDDPALLASALADPVGFVESDRPLVIDEVQRAPGLLLAIKARVDRDPRPGQFLLTGSAQAFALRGWLTPCRGGWKRCTCGRCRRASSRDAPTARR